MMGIIIAFLFILQIVSFLIITLLYVKITKFNDLEKKQRKLMQQMDDSVMAYLTEIKEENDRLIAQLDAAEKREKQEERQKPADSEEPAFKENAEQQEFERKSHPVPVRHVIRSYQQTAAAKEETEQRPLTDRERAKQMHAEGRTVQEIAKELGKGQTEIELLLKFS